MMVADFNRDGKADIVTANTIDGTLTLLLGDGAGHFTEAPLSPIEAPGKAVLAIATGDFNGDGNPDLVVTSGFGTEILLGDGMGGFVKGAGMPAPYNLPGALGASGNLLAVGDFNSDGKLDLITVGPLTGSSVWPGDGTGGFGQPLDSPLQADSIEISSIAMGDFNGDGKLDLAAGAGVPGMRNNLAVYAGDGTGRFQAILNSPIEYDLYMPIAAGDFSGAGRSDVLIFTAQEELPFQTWTWLWTGATSTPFPFNLVTSKLQDSSTFVTVGDFNGDGKLDWAGVNPYSGTVLGALGDGTGAFTPAPGSPYVVGGTPFALATGDFNGDGKVDLAIDTGSSVVLLLNGNPYANGPLPFIASVVNAASYVSEPLPASSYATVYGSNLAASAGDPSVRATITDVNGNQVSAGVLYAGPGQVNILVPGGLALGAASLGVSNSLGVSVPFAVTTGTLAPGLFTVDSTGTIPAGQVVTVAPNNSQTVQALANCTGGTCTLVPIALDPANQTYLILYGTGIRGVGTASEVLVTFNGNGAASASYAGPQGEYPGLDQVNVPIPPSLAGQGRVTVELTIRSGPQFTANPVQLAFQ